MGSLCIWFPFTIRFLVLLKHLDSEGDAAQELIPLVVVAEVGSLHPALHYQFLVVVLLGEQQFHSHQRLNVILLH